MNYCESLLTARRIIVGGFSVTTHDNNTGAKSYLVLKEIE